MDWIKIKSSLNYDDLNKSGLASSFIDDLKSLANSDLSDEEFVTLLDRYYTINIGSFILEMLEKGKLFQEASNKKFLYQYKTDEIMAYRTVSFDLVSVAYFVFTVISQIAIRSHSIVDLENAIKSRQALVISIDREEKEMSKSEFFDDNWQLTFTDSRDGSHIAHRYRDRDAQIARINIANLTIRNLGLYGPWILPLLRDEFANRNLNRDILDIIEIVQREVEVQRQGVQDQITSLQTQIVNLQSQLNILETYSASLKSETEKLQPDKKSTERGSFLLSTKKDQQQK